MPIYSAESLFALERKELQQIAKGLGLKQNAKSSKLISQILAKNPPAAAKDASAALPRSSSLTATEFTCTNKASQRCAPTQCDCSPSARGAHPAQQSSKRQRFGESPPAAKTAARLSAASAKATSDASANNVSESSSAESAAAPHMQTTAGAGDEPFGASDTATAFGSEAVLNTGPSFHAVPALGHSASEFTRLFLLRHSKPFKYSVDLFFTDHFTGKRVTVSRSPEGIPLLPPQQLEQIKRPMELLLVAASFAARRLPGQQHLLRPPPSLCCLQADHHPWARQCALETTLIAALCCRVAVVSGTERLLSCTQLRSVGWMMDRVLCHRLHRVQVLLQRRRESGGSDERCRRSRRAH
jgi:hypothetical protein